MIILYKEDINVLFIWEEKNKNSRKIVTLKKISVYFETKRIIIIYLMDGGFKISLWIIFFF